MKAKALGKKRTLFVYAQVGQLIPCFDSMAYVCLRGGFTVLTMIGYARVSTEEQLLDLQMDALEGAGCSRIFTDHGVSAISKRPGFEEALALLEAGDTFVIWKMDRAFRSLRHALDVLELFEQRGIQFKAITEAIDTTTPMGKCMYQIRNAFAELERNLISERTSAGMRAAQKRGRILGRPKALSDEQIQQAKAILEANPDTTLTSLAKKFGVSTKTLRRALKS